MLANNQPIYKFTLGITNLIPVFDHPDTDAKLEQVRPSGSQYEAVEKVVIPWLEKVGFFDKTKFRTLGFYFDLVKSSNPQHVVQLVQLKTIQGLMVTKGFHEDELLPALEANFESFALEQIGQLLSIVCDKYKLDRGVLGELNPAIRGMGCGNDNHPPKVQFIEVENELRINVKLCDRGFGTDSEFQANTKLMDDLDELLNSGDLGHVDGSEIGIGYETIFCLGRRPKSMYRRIATRLKSLPAGSYVELVANGKTDRIYPSQ